MERGNTILNTQIEETIIAEQPNKAVTKPVKKRISAGRVILCILLSVILFADIIVISAVTTVRTVVTKENISELLENTDYMTIPLKIDDVQSNLYEMFFFAFARMSTGNVDIYELAEDTEFEKILSEYLYSYASFILYDTKLKEIDSDVIMDFYDDNSDEISREFGAIYDRNEIREVIEKQDEIFDKLTDDEIEKLIPMLSLIRFMMSLAALIIFGVLAVILIVVIGILSRSVGTPLVATGISATATGLAVITFGILAFLGVIGVPAASITTASIIWQGVLSSIISKVIVIFVYMLTAGIILIITGGFIGQIRRNIRKSKQA